jgi:hypothetical protein
MVVDAVIAEPVSAMKFPENRELTGKISDFGPFLASSTENSDLISARYGQFPCLLEQGI